MLKHQRRGVIMTHVPSAVAKRMDKFFLVTRERDNLARKLEKAEKERRDNLMIVYRRLLEKAEKNLIIIRSEIENLEISIACGFGQFAEE